ncbi:hypothetical protein F5884DRAFT_37449 [Xylogone sp. PMI_703]|nr:hypothetical protein F5884DRAFT_37449 [Xylogone sp. PMI_703]
MAASLLPLQNLITLHVLEDIRQVWFQHLENEDDYLAPGREKVLRWFRTDEEFDKICIDKFYTILEEIRSSNLTAEYILQTLNPVLPLDWLSLVLLFDQITRNSYRGDKSRLVFNYYDLIAREITLRAIKNGIPESPTLQCRFALRMWFYMPLTHSEDLELHRVAISAYEKMISDAEEYHLPSTAIQFGNSLLNGEKDRYGIIERFGRLPHRNGPLGRETTSEEKEYLEKGSA